MLRPKAATSSLAAWRLSSRQPSCRHFAATAHHSSPSSRSYFYDVDIHGQLFLSDAKHRNVATAYRDVRFLDTFFTRIRRNEHLATEEAREARLKGYEFVSECMGEINYVRPDPEGTALVFQALDGTGAFFSLWARSDRRTRSLAEVRVLQISDTLALCRSHLIQQHCESTPRRDTSSTLRP